MGQFNETGRKAGLGRQLWPDGCYYEGQFSNDKWNGQGRLIDVINGVYEGDWKDSKAHGNGVLTQPGNNY